MITINRIGLAFIFTALSVTPLLAQSANRTIVGVPPATPSIQTATTPQAPEPPDVQRCRLHCGAIAGTPNMKAVATLPVQQAQAQACERKMIVNR